MATIEEASDALAELLRDGLDVKYAHGTWPATPQALSVVVAPPSSDDYFTFENATFCTPLWRLSAWLIGPSVSLVEGLRWLNARLPLVPSVMNADPKLNGRTSPIAFLSAGPPGRITETASNPLLAVELRFTPFSLKT